MDPLSLPATPTAQAEIAQYAAAAAAEAGLDPTTTAQLQAAVATGVSDALARQRTDLAEAPVLRVSSGLDQSALTVTLEDRGWPTAFRTTPDAAEGPIEEAVRQRAGDWNCRTFAVRLHSPQDALNERSDEFRDAVIRVILPIGIALSGEGDLDRLLERILRETKAICHADGGTLYLREGDDLRFAMMLNDSLRIAAGGTTGQAVALPPVKLVDAASGELNYQNVASCAALRGIAINVPDIYNAAHFDFSGTRLFDERNGYRSISCLTVPLKDHGGEVIGVLQLLNAQDPQTGRVIAFDGYLQQVVEALASQAAVVLNNRMLLTRQEALLKLERELQIGREMQASFLPKSLPRAPGWESAAQFRPAREVAGDFYDAFYLEGGEQLVLVVGDVCGKGVGAALFMALVRTLVRAFAGLCRVPANDEGDAEATQPSLSRLAALTNAYIIQNHADAAMFATLFLGLLDPRTGHLSYVNAGHCPPLFLRADGSVTALSGNAPAVGMFGDVDFETREVTFAPGDAVLVFTDGLTEAEDGDGQLFGEERLLQVLREPLNSARALTDRVARALDRFVGATAQSDDLTLLVVHRLTEAAPPA